MSRRYASGAGFASAEPCPDCLHTRCGEDCTCNCEAAFAESEAATLRADLGKAQRMNAQLESTCAEWAAKDVRTQARIADLEAGIAAARQGLEACGRDKALLRKLAREEKARFDAELDAARPVLQACAAIPDVELNSSGNWYGWAKPIGVALRVWFQTEPGKLARRAAREQKEQGND